MTEDAVPLFNDRDANIPEARLDVPRPGRPERDKLSSRATDLTGKAKAIMAIGLGATGKTTLLRWLCERALERSDDELALATVDPVNRELGHYFPAAMAPPTQDPTQVTAWLEQLLAMVMETRKSVALDFGGGDTTLARLLAEVPDLQQMMESAGVEPVVLYPLTPRSSDLTPLATMAQAGFRPKATALILNEGRADSTRAAPAGVRTDQEAFGLQVGDRAGCGRNLDATSLCCQGHRGPAHRFSTGGERRGGGGQHWAWSIRPQPDASLARGNGRRLCSDCKLAALKAVALAPETGMAVRAAQQALEQEASKAEAVNDPTGPALRALSLAVGACHKLYVDGSMTIGSLIETARQPAAPEDIRVAVAQGIRASASGAVRALNIRNILIASSVLVGSNVLTAGTVYWWTASNLEATVAALDVRVSGSASERWRSLIEANPGDLIEKERGPCRIQNGGMACQFNLWMTPAAPKAE